MPDLQQPSPQNASRKQFAFYVNLVGVVYSVSLRCLEELRVIHIARKVSKLRWSPWQLGGLLIPPSYTTKQSTFTVSNDRSVSWNILEESGVLLICQVNQPPSPYTSPIKIPDRRPCWCWVIRLGVLSLVLSTRLTGVLLSWIFLSR